MTSERMAFHGADAKAGPARRPHASGKVGLPSVEVRKVALSEDRLSDVLSVVDERLSETEPFKNSWHLARKGAARVLSYLHDLPGDTWTDRWLVSGAEEFSNMGEWGKVLLRRTEDSEAGFRSIGRGVQALIAADAFRPSHQWMITAKFPWLCAHVHTFRGDPSWPLIEPFLRAEGVPTDSAEYAQRSWMRARLMQIAVFTGKQIADLHTNDLVTNAVQIRNSGRKVYGLADLAHVLNAHGFAHQAEYASVSRRAGQPSVRQMVESYAVRNDAIREVLIAYIERRSAGLDWSTADGWARRLVRNFWCFVESKDPDASSLELSNEVTKAWKDWLRHVRDDQGNPLGQRNDYYQHLQYVRRFYLDIQEWAHDDPETWGPWAARPPVVDLETRGASKHRRRRQSDMYERIRARVPEVEFLLNLASQRYEDARGLLEVARTTPLGETFQWGPMTLLRIGAPGRLRVMVAPVIDGEAQGGWDAARAEERAFWAYAVSTLLRHSGVRIEELMEVSQFSIRDYTHPDPHIGRVPLMHVAPSKTDKERIIVLEPEAIAVVGAILRRVRAATNCGRSLPVVVRYDNGQREDLPPMPLLFQRSTLRSAQAVPKAIPTTWIVSVLNELCEAAGLRGKDSTTLKFTPHDFRRIFATEKQGSGGLAPHIIQQLLGHESINTTQGYQAVFDHEVIAAHARHIAARRQMRPDEYRPVTEDEWAAFSENFMARKIAIGDCMRQYESACDHEYACERCSLARVDDAGAERLRATLQDLRRQYAEAEARNWRGEMESRLAIIDSIERKLTSFEDRAQRSKVVMLGIPAVPTDDPT